MHELDLTKESSLPPPLLCSPSSSILPFLSSREPGHAPALLRSSAAVFGKINGATGNGQGQKVTSAGARGRSVDVSTAGA